MNNADMPAMPQDYTTWCEGIGNCPTEGAGLTKREQFCLQMGAPETGDPELDEIIHQGNIKNLSAKLLGGLLASGYHMRANEKEIVELAAEYAELLLKELNK